MDYGALFADLNENGFESWSSGLPEMVRARVEGSNNGHLGEWMEVLKALPKVEKPVAELGSTVSLGDGGHVDGLETTLKRLKPWRKGPFELDGVFIDTEWRSDWKWERVKDGIADLQGRKVLDIGCGNGYHLWRMLEAGAELALGVDPYLLYVMQYWAVKHFAPEGLPAWVLPLGIEDLPDELPVFDTVFSMGVLYHRRSPLDHLAHLQRLIRPGGQVVLETLVIEGGEGRILMPKGRYAKMRNVWFIPSVEELEKWMRRLGWKNVRCVDVCATTVEEQRATDWMSFESLCDFLDPEDSSKTVEGYPGPVRAVMVAER